MSQFRSHQSELVATVHAEPIMLPSRGVGRRAVLVSPEFYERALEALGDKIDAEAVAGTRKERSWFSHRRLMDELGL